jgi:hypothetical protein
VKSVIISVLNFFFKIICILLFKFSECPRRLEWIFTITTKYVAHFTLFTEQLSVPYTVCSPAELQITLLWNVMLCTLVAIFQCLEDRIGCTWGLCDVLVNFLWVTWHHIPDDCSLYNHCHKNLKYQSVIYNRKALNQAAFSRLTVHHI